MGSDLRWESDELPLKMLATFNHCRTSVLTVLVGTLTLTLWGCTGERDQGCAALCIRQVTFSFAAPQAGSVFQIALAPGDNTVNCRVNALREASCDQVASIEHIAFEANYLKRIVWREPPVGELRIELTVDGRQAARQTFSYSLTPVPGPCELCYKDPEYVVD